MPNFCSNCAATLEPDAKFCPSCSAPVTVSAALASELRAGVRTGVRSLVQAPSLKVQPPIWAGVIEVFWILLNWGSALVYSVLAYVGIFAAGAAGVFGQQAEAERFAVWFIVSSFFYLVQLSFQVPLAFGFFMQKRWAYGLYLWSIGPLILAGLILRVAAPSIEALEQKLPLSLSMLATFGWILGLGLVALQVFLVLKSKEHLVH